MHEFSLRISTPAPLSQTDQPLFHVTDERGDDGLLVDIHDGLLRCRLTTEGEPFEVAVPLSAIGADAAHTLVLQSTQARIELFVDGVLVDEEWILGESPLRLEDLRAAAASGKAAFVTINPAPLTAEEIAEEEGGPETVNRNRARFFGDPIANKQYWKPAGYNTHAGDCMPFFHDGVYHLFFLFDRRSHRSKRRQGAHQWAHISSTDLIHWDEHEMAIPITEQWEGSICTGSLFYHAGQYIAYYAVRMADYSAAKMTTAVSRDCSHFEKTGSSFVLSHPYEPTSARDPIVFADEAGLFHMLVTTETTTPQPLGRTGCLAHLTSTDLTDWKQQEPFLVTGFNDQPECADYFSWNGFYYLIFSNHGVARYRYSTQPFGPWLKPDIDMFDCSQLRVMKTAAFTDNRRIGAAFVCTGGDYGGRLVFREMLQAADGTISTAFVPEMIPTGTPVALPTPLAICGECNLTAGAALKSQAAVGVAGDMALKLKTGDGLVTDVTLKSETGYAVAEVADAPGRFRLSLSVEPAQGTGFCGVFFAPTAFTKEGYELRLEPSKSKVGIRGMPEDANNACDHQSLYQIPFDQTAVDITIISQDGLLDVEVNGNRTLIAFATVPSSSKIYLYVQHGSATFRAIRLWEG